MSRFSFDTPSPFERRRPREAFPASGTISGRRSEESEAAEQMIRERSPHRQSDLRPWSLHSKAGRPICQVEQPGFRIDPINRMIIPHSGHAAWLA